MHVKKEDSVGFDQPVHGGLVPSELRALGLSRDKIIDFSVNINPLGPPPAALAALQGLDISSYPDPECLELKEALAAVTKVSLSRIVIGNGTSELIHSLIRGCAVLSENVLVLMPTFGEYETAAKRCGLTVTRLSSTKQDGFTWNSDAVNRIIRRCNPDLVFLCNPNNPTGHYLSFDQVTAIAEAVGKGILVVDDSYRAFADEPWDTMQLLDRNNVVILHSMTKEYAMAGLRLGYALCPKPVARALLMNQPSWNVNTAAQVAGLAALSEHEHLERSRTCIRHAKIFLMGELHSLGMSVIPSSTNFFLVQVDDAPVFRYQLLTKGICVRDCSSFGLPNYIRIGIRPIDECRKLVAAIEGIIPQQRIAAGDQHHFINKKDGVQPGGCI